MSGHTLSEPPPADRVPGGSRGPQGAQRPRTAAEALSEPPPADRVPGGSRGPQGAQRPRTAAEAGATRPIRFGSGGWRGVLADEITLDRVRAALAGIAGWLRESGADGPLIIARDRRFFGPVLVGLAVHELTRAGFRVRRIDEPVPTPVVAHAMRRGRAALGLVFTASHNPPIDHGLKLVAPGGAMLARAATDRIEQLATQALRRPATEARQVAASKRREQSIASARPLDPRPRYLADWLRLLDTEAIARARHTIVYDALHGAGAGVLDVGLIRAGARVETLRASVDPSFGGAAPDPVDAQLDALRRHVRRDASAELGLATDGDADRLAVVDAAGRALSDCELLGVLVDHCARTGRVRDAVALSDATGSFVARVAAHHGLAVVRCGAGFRSLSAALSEGRASLAGDESGGFAWARFGVDKDGILAAGLFAELAASAAGGVAGRLRALSRAVGPGFWRRASLPRTPAALAALARLRRSAPGSVGSSPVCTIDRRDDALRLELSDGFVLLRASSTEKALRLFAEGPNAASAERRLRAAARWLRG